MDVYLSDEEQAQKLKEWWKKYGSAFLIGILLFLAISFGWRYWQAHKAQHTDQASYVYEQLIAAHVRQQYNDSSLFAQHLMKNYANTPYAGLGALLLAKEKIGAQNLEGASKDLQWVIAHSDNNSLRQVARIRLARIFVAQNRVLTGLKLLQKVDDSAYNAVVAELKGDIYLKQNKKVAALASYRKAAKIRKQEKKPSPMLQMKLNQLK